MKKRAAEMRLFFCIENKGEIVYDRRREEFIMKKRTVIITFLLSILLLSSCGMESIVPEESDVISQYFASQNYYRDCVKALEEISFDAMISRADYYMPTGSESFTGLYIQDMEHNTFTSLEDGAVKKLMDQGDVKLIDSMRREDLFICTFDLCIPGKNFDYGFYYTSGDEPIYFGDPSMKLSDSGDGVYRYEMKSSYGVKFSYLTKQIDVHFYYYEIL